jgi:sulfur dioxygenase
VRLKLLDELVLGSHPIEVRATRGHTGTCLSFYLTDLCAVLTSDALLVRGCGRTHFKAATR